MFELEYKAAAAEGALLELKLRLLADKVPGLRELAFDKDLKDVEGHVVQHFNSALTDDEKLCLNTCRQLRNKILHCDFRKARIKLGKSDSGGVKKIDISQLTTAQIALKVADAQKGVPGTFTYVAETESSAGTVFGWLMELGSAGDFQSAVAMFKQASNIIDRLSQQHSD